MTDVLFKQTVNFILFTLYVCSHLALWLPLGKGIKVFTSLVVHNCQSLSQHEVTRSIATPPGWDASLLQVTPQHFVAGTQLYSGWRETLRVIKSVLPKNTTH